ncbi:MAG: hypothetical protein L0H19_06855 [Salinisphaera sp.]|nr:hypothetical protein [Salinisphaera sp.]
MANLAENWTRVRSPSLSAKLPSFTKFFSAYITSAPMVNPGTGEIVFEGFPDQVVHNEKLRRDYLAL